MELVKTRIPQRFGFDAMHDIQVLCPMNRGGAGARSLNIELQAALNPAGERKVERFGWTFAPGDKVMQIENDYDKEVYNGDIGLVADVDPEAGELTARFEGRDLVYGFGELDTLVPAYAATVHKSQGSEYPAVVIPVLTQHYAMLRRNLLYTGVIRMASRRSTSIPAVPRHRRVCRIPHRPSDGPATRPASTSAGVPRRCAPRWRPPSSGPPAPPAACRACRPVEVDPQVAREVAAGDLRGKERMAARDDDARGHVEDAFAAEEVRQGLVAVGEAPEPFGAGGGG